MHLVSKALHQSHADEKWIGGEGIARLPAEHRKILLSVRTLRGKKKGSPELTSSDLYPIWLPTLDTLRNFFLMPTTEMLTVFQKVRDIML
jgi:hypothetical protein